MADEKQPNGADYDGVLADLIARRDRLNATIAELQAIAAGGRCDRLYCKATSGEGCW